MDLVGYVEVAVVEEVLLADISKMDRRYIQVNRCRLVRGLQLHTLRLYHTRQGKGQHIFVGHRPYLEHIRCL